MIPTVPAPSDAPVLADAGSFLTAFLAIPEEDGARGDMLAEGVQTASPEFWLLPPRNCAVPADEDIEPLIRRDSVTGPALKAFGAVGEVASGSQADPLLESGVAPEEVAGFQIVACSSEEQKVTVPENAAGRGVAMPRLAPDTAEPTSDPPPVDASVAVEGEGVRDTGSAEEVLPAQNPAGAPLATRSGEVFLAAPRPGPAATPGPEEPVARPLSRTPQTAPANGMADLRSPGLRVPPSGQGAPAAVPEPAPPPEAAAASPMLPHSRLAAGAAAPPDPDRRPAIAAEPSRARGFWEGIIVGLSSAEAGLETPATVGAPHLGRDPGAEADALPDAEPLIATPATARQGPVDVATPRPVTGRPQIPLGPGQGSTAEATLREQASADSGVAVLPSLPAPAGLAAPAGAASLPATSPTPQIAPQIVAALSHSQDGVTELALSPEELGHVRLRLEPDATNPDRMVVMITFERPETLDLFRRHAGDLAEALRAAGYAGSDIGFGQDGGSFGGRPGQGPAGSAAPADRGENADPPETAPRLVAGASLDLRL